MPGKLMVTVAALSPTGSFSNVIYPSRADLWFSFTCWGELSLESLPRFIIDYGA